MNDPTRNELLSAYLDGELTADEQAEVERLLAADPAARQLLDELRALSVALQTLPREELGEDLSEKVIRAAGRRVLLEGTPEPDDQNAAVPLSRTILGRVFNTRTVTYASITAALAAVIMLVDPGRNRAPTDKLGKEVAVATPKLEELQLDRHEQDGQGLPPTVQSTRNSVAESPIVLEMDRGPVMRATPEPKADTYAAKSLKASPRPVDESFGISAAPDFNDHQGGFALAKKGRPRSGEEMLVVHCDVTPEAFANNDFDKLLTSNGIVRRRQFNAITAPPAAPASDERLKEKRTTGKELGAGATPAPSPLDSENVNLVYAEGTPEQIEATLAAIGASRAAFSNVMISPHDRLGGQAEGGRGIDSKRESKNGPTGKSAERAPPRSMGRSKAVPRAGPGTFDAPPSANGTMEHKRQPQPAQNGNKEDGKWKDADNKREDGEVERESADKKTEKGEAAKPGRDDKSNSRQQMGQPKRSAAPQRVLFVLRIVPTGPPHAAARIQASKEPAPTEAELTPPPPAKSPAEKK